MSEASRSSILGLIDDDSSDQNGEFDISQAVPFRKSLTLIHRLCCHYQRATARPTRQGPSGRSCSPCH
jgi:hypothetical protein